MAQTTAKSLREKTSQELIEQMMLEKKRLFDGIVKSSTGEAIKPHEKRDGRRLIARIRAILRERELRSELDKRIVDLQPKAEGVSPAVAQVVKKIETRLAAVKAELAKPVGERVQRPLMGRLRTRHAEAVTAADRAAVRLVDAKRRRFALERLDVGESK